MAGSARRRSAPLGTVGAAGQDESGRPGSSGRCVVRQARQDWATPVVARHGRNSWSRHADAGLGRNSLSWQAVRGLVWQETLVGALRRWARRGRIGQAARGSASHVYASHRWHGRKSGAGFVQVRQDRRRSSRFSRARQDTAGQVALVRVSHARASQERLRLSWHVAARHSRTCVVRHSAAQRVLAGSARSCTAGHVVIRQDRRSFA
jgi:hypothetical protein